MHLDDAVLAVQHPLEGLAEYGDVPAQLRGAGLSQHGSPLLCQFVQVHRAVLLLLLQLLLQIVKQDKNDADYLRPNA